MILPICKDVYFTSSSAASAAQNEVSSLGSAHFLEIGGSSGDGADLHLCVIDAFCETLASTVESRPDVPIIVCPENDSLSSLRGACLLCGAYLLLSEGIGLDFVVSTFSQILSDASAWRAEGVDEPIMSCWSALQRARDLQWIGSQCDGAELGFDLELATHYALAANGGVHVLIPGKLLLAPPPAPLPDGQGWADVTEAGRPAGRLFSAGFLADTLVDLDVSAAAWLGRAGESDAAATRARGLDVHDLGLDARKPALLQAMDRLLAVSRAAPGAVAVMGDMDGDGVVGTVAAAWMMADYGFGGDAAGAWLRLVCPSLSGGGKGL